MENFKEYIDNGDNYVPPERQFENEVIDIRLYCLFDKCNKYIKGTEGYNGGFVAETGQYADLRNQCWYCNEHIPVVNKLHKKLKKAKLRIKTKKM